jgi:hypothetical protein
MPRRTPHERRTPSDLRCHRTDAPFSRRGFMTATAAVTAGYTLAAGPVRPTSSRPTPTASPPAMAGSRWPTARCPAISPAPMASQIRRSSWWRWGSLGCTNTSRRRLAKLGAFAVAPDYYFRKGTRSHQDHRYPAAIIDREFETGCRIAVRSRQHRGVGEVARRRYLAARHHRVLPRWTDGLGICRP